MEHILKILAGLCYNLYTKQAVTIKNELEDRITIVDEQLYDVEDESSPRQHPYPYRSTLTVSEASYTDTGYFACHHRDSEEGDEEVKTYIYVEGEIVRL